MQTYLDPQTAFGRHAVSLGLMSLFEIQRSTQLRAWVERHRFTRYVPEDLLIHWGLQVSADDDKLFTTRELELA